MKFDVDRSGLTNTIRSDLLEEQGNRAPIRAELYELIVYGMLHHLLFTHMRVLVSRMQKNNRSSSRTRTLLVASRCSDLSYSSFPPSTPAGL